MRHGQRTPPPEFSSLGWLGEFRSTDGRSWRGPCPVCGGHRRFLVFTDREYPYWNYLCSCCNYRGTVNQLLGGKVYKPTEEDRARWQAQRADEEQTRKNQQEQALERYLREKIWEVAHAQLDETALAWWQGRGVSAEWVEFWRLGAIDRILWNSAGERFAVPSYTIPKYQLLDDSGVPKNTDFRLAHEVPDFGKYMGISHLPAAVFVAQPSYSEVTRSGEIFVVEGSIKAMVLHTRLDPRRQVIGIPSAKSWVNVVDLVRGRADRVYVILDPDAAAAALELASEIGKAARVLTLPVKIDDAFNQHGLTARLFESYLRQARTV